jgi:hypothetical protein
MAAKASKEDTSKEDKPHTVSCGGHFAAFPDPKDWLKMYIFLGPIYLQSQEL